MALRGALRICLHSNMNSMVLRTFASQAAPRIGLVGMGQVGSAVSNNLMRDGHNVQVYYDANPDMPTWGREPILKNMRRLGSVKEVAQNSDIVITAVGKPYQIREVVLGETGLFAGMRQGAMWIDHTTSSYEQTIELTGEATKQGFRPVECPVTGGLAALRNGGMAAFIGGEEATVEEAKPIIASSCTTFVHVGPVGTATIAKVMSNMLCGVNFIAAYEAMMVAKKAGIDLHRFWNAIRVSSGTSFSWETAVPFIMNENYEKDFSIDLHCKDFALGHKIAENYGVPMEINAMTQQIFNRARAKFGEDAGCYIASKLLEDDMGESLKHEDFKNWDYDLEAIDGSLVVKHKRVFNNFLN